MGFWGGRHEKTINHARKPPAPGIKPRPLKRHTISHHLAGEIPGKGGGGAAVGRGHVHVFPIFAFTPASILMGAGRTFEEFGIRQGRITSNCAVFHKKPALGQFKEITRARATP